MMSPTKLCLFILFVFQFVFVFNFLSLVLARSSETVLSYTTLSLGQETPPAQALPFYAFKKLARPSISAFPQCSCTYMSLYFHLCLGPQLNSYLWRIFICIWIHICINNFIQFALNLCSTSICICICLGGGGQGVRHVLILSLLPIWTYISLFSNINVVKVLQINFGPRPPHCCWGPI